MRSLTIVNYYYQQYFSVKVLIILCSVYFNLEITQYHASMNDYYLHISYIYGEFSEYILQILLFLINKC